MTPTTPFPEEKTKEDLEVLRGRVYQVIGQSQSSWLNGGGPMVEEITEALTAFEEAVRADHVEQLAAITTAADLYSGADPTDPT